MDIESGEASRISQGRGADMTSDLGGVAARGGKIILVSQMVRFVIMVASAAVLARLISPASFGLFAMVTALVALADVLRDMGLSMVALRSPTLSRGQKSNLFWLSFLSGLVLASLIYFCAPLVAAFYAVPELEGLTHIVALTFAINGAAAQFRVQINRDMRFVALAVTDIVPYLIGFGTAALLAINGAEYRALAWQLVAVSITTLLISVPLSKWIPGAPALHENMRSLFVFGSAFVGSQLVTYGMRNTDSIAIGRFWGAAALGPYDRAYQLMMIPINNLIAPLGRVAIPVMARGGQGELGKFATIAHLSIGYLTTGPYLLLAGMSGPVVALILGPDWSAAAPLLAILALGGAFRAVAQVSNWMYVAVGGAAKFLRLQILSQIGVVLFMLIGVAWGPMGVAIGHSAGFALYWVCTLLWTGRELTVNVGPMLLDGIRILFVIGFPAMALGWCATLVPGASWFQLIAGGVGFLLWMGLLWAVSGRVRRELRVLVWARRGR